MTDVATLVQFLYEGDILGFIQAIYVAAFANADVFYGMAALLLTSPLYIRTRSLLLLCILWVLIGPLIIVAMPIVAGVGIFLTIIGIAGLLFKLFLGTRGG